MKRVTVITQQLGTNYGGILQAYALQSTLRGLGYEVSTTYSRGGLIKEIVKSLPGTKGVINLVHRRKGATVDIATVSRYTSAFIDNNISTSSFAKTLAQGYLHLNTTSLVVGSDQVWRRPYTPYLLHNFLIFSKNSSAVKISYAASFGKDDLDEYTPRLIKKAGVLAGKFNAISVREHSGIDITERHWDLKAVQHVDPTLLLEAPIYSNLIDDSIKTTSPSRGSLFSYVLDPAKDKQGIAQAISRRTNLKMFTVIDGDENNGKPMPPVEQWLRSFRDAKYVVTDSFHGTVFAIIFNKPFIAIGNKERGLARFTSLLKIFNLEDRLVTSVDDLTSELINKPIDWSFVNTKIRSERKRSLNYLSKHLG